MKCIGGYSFRTYTTMEYEISDPTIIWMRKAQIDFINSDFLSESLCCQDLFLTALTTAYFIPLR